MRNPSLVVLLATLILSSCPTPALAATEAEVATTRTTVNVVLPMLSIALLVVVVLIIKAVKIESKAGETPWSIVLVIILAFFLGTMATSFLPTGKWVSDAIVKSYHPDAPAETKKDDPKSGDPVGSPADYVTLKGSTLERNDKELPKGWDVGMTQADGVAGNTVTKSAPRVIDPSLPVFLFFNPDTSILKGKGVQGTMKFR